jgi:hypothetical protein
MRASPKLIVLRCIKPPAQSTTGNCEAYSPNHALPLLEHDSIVRYLQKLWYGNTANTGGAGAATVMNPIIGNPAFAPDGYHLTSRSAAIDAGVDASITTDVDGDPRPIGRPDLGADEWGTKVFLPLTLSRKPHVPFLVPHFPSPIAGWERGNI